MIVRAINDYKDSEFGRLIKANEAITVRRERGLSLINSGFARLISEDDIPVRENEELKAKISKLEQENEELRAKISELEQPEEPKRGRKKQSDE